MHCLKLIRPALVFSVAAVLLPSSATAQTANSETANAAPPAGTQELASKLQTPEMLFNATVQQTPSRALIAAGRMVAMGGTKQGGAAMACFTCHGADGAGDGAGAVPRIAGMPAWYLHKQLDDYAAGTRHNSAMTGIAQKLTQAERESVSAYYALLEAPYPPTPDFAADRELQWGQQLAAVGSAGRAVPACINCHGPAGSGMAPSVPYLAGQYAEYIALQLSLWKEGERNNDPANVMRAIARKMTAGDMRAVGRYYERVRPLGEPEPPLTEMNR